MIYCETHHVGLREATHEAQQPYRMIPGCKLIFLCKDCAKTRNQTVKKEFRAVPLSEETKHEMSQMWNANEVSQGPSKR